MNGCENLQVEKVAGGQVPPDQDIRLFAELILSDTEDVMLQGAQEAGSGGEGLKSAVPLRANEVRGTAARR